MKRIISLVLAISLILSLFTVNASAALPPGRYGDVDQSSAHAITIADATAIQQQAVGLGEQYFEGFHVFHPFGYCDVNGDERLSILDVTCIQKYIAEFTSGAGRTGEKVVFDLPEEWYE